MNAKLEFDLSDPDQRSEFNRVLKADKSVSALWEIGQRVFRPARKHGYSDLHIMEAFAQCGEGAEVLVGRLESLFYEVLEEHGINLDELWS